MIRRSTAIAVVAIVLSLLVHLTGLRFAPSGQPDQNADGGAPDVVEMGNAFEDVAEAPSEPVPPEPAQTPEPPVETPPEPEVTEPATSEVLVQSANPKRVFAPDNGMATPVEPDTTGRAEPDKTGTPEPETLAPTSGDEGTATTASATQPVETETIAQAPKGAPDATAQPEQTAPAEPIETETATPEQLAALPTPVAPTPPVAQTPQPSPVPAVPVVPLQPEQVSPVAPEEPETVVEPVPDATEDDPSEVAETNTDANSDAEGTELAVATSPRPRLPERPPEAEPQGQADGSEQVTEPGLPPTQRIESPLTVYQRDGVDLLAGRRSQSQSGGIGFLESRNTGNADRTNYAGQVLMHLNRAPVVHVSGRGYARVFFEINPDGTLAWVDIIDGTGSPEIESAAKKQVRVASPFPRPPKGASRKLVFVYRIQ